MTKYERYTVLKDIQDNILDPGYIKPLVDMLFKDSEKEVAKELNKKNGTTAIGKIIEKSIKAVAKDHPEKGFVFKSEKAGLDLSFTIEGPRAFYWDDKTKIALHYSRNPSEIDSMKKVFDAVYVDYFEGNSDYQCIEFDAEKIKIDTKELETKIKLQKMKFSAVYHHFEDTDVCINASYLVDAINFTEDTKCYVNKNKKLGPIYFYNKENGRGCIVLPVKPSDSVKEHRGTYIH